MPCHPRYTTLEASTKLVISAISGRFCGLLPTIFASRADFDALSPPVHDSRGIDETRDFGHFLPFSWLIAHDFRVPGGFRCPLTPGTRL